MCVCVCVSVYVCMHVSVYHVCICMYVCVCICMVCVCLPIYIYIYIYIIYIYIYKMVKLIRRESRSIIIRRKYKPEDLCIIFRPEVATSLQLNRKFQPCYKILPDSICYSIQFDLPNHYFRVQARQTVS